MLEWVANYSVIVVPVMMIASGAGGFFLRRLISGQAEVEDQESLERAINLDRLLKSEGLSLREAKELREKFRSSGDDSLLKAQAELIVAKNEEAEMLSDESLFSSRGVTFADTTLGMQLKTAGELSKLDNDLQFAIVEFAQECTETRHHALYDAQEAWESYRKAEASFASLLWEGGTGAPLLGAARMIELTEQRIKDIRLAQAEAKL